MDKEIRFLLDNRRSLISNETDLCLDFIKKRMPELEVLEFNTNEKIGGWEIPYKWEVDHAYLKDKNGNIICDCSKEPLSLIGYSTSYKGLIDTKALKSHIYYIENFPDAIPYITSYYKKQWGFCMKYSDFLNLSDENYYVDIKSDFQEGSLKIGSLLIEGKSEKEI